MNEQPVITGTQFLIGVACLAGLVALGVAFATYVWPWLAYLQEKNEYKIEKRRDEWVKTRDAKPNEDTHVRPSNKP